MKRILLINFLLFILLFFIVDITVFYKMKNRFSYPKSYFSFLTRNFDGVGKKNEESYKIDIINNSSDNFTPPHHIHNELPAIVFSGCSFMSGAEIEKHETLPHRLSKYIENPMYNVAFPGSAINHSLYFLKNGVHFDKIKNAKVVVYLYSEFHVRRLLMPNLMFEPYLYLYKEKNGNLVERKNPFIISRFASISILRENIIEYLLYNNKNYQNYAKKLLKLHIIEMKKEIDKRYDNATFLLLVYYTGPMFEQVAMDLEKEGIVIYKIGKELNIDLHNPKYQMPEGHPCPLVWIKTSPKIAEKIKQYL